MTNSRLGLCLLVLLLPLAARGADSDVPKAVKDAEAAAARLDELLTARWSAAKAQPAPLADDAEFLRRAYLDLAGTIPSVGEVRDFLDDRSPDKRRRLITRLLDSATYAGHFANVWGEAWLPDSPTVNNLGVRPGFEAWLRARLSENAGYDQMVREVLTATAAAPNPRLGFAGPGVGANSGLTPVGFSLAAENKPENLAGSTSRLFLAIRLECAQCHAHPFAEWKREQFWSYAAFFGPGGGTKKTIAIPGLGKTVEARFPDGGEPKFKAGVSPRATLAEWATSPENKYFARAAVNRVWTHFFGAGLVEPVDDLSREEGKDELLTTLAAQFAEHKFDLKFLIRTIVSTRAYQLTSVATHSSQDDPHLFARMAVKGLTSEQVIASLTEATGFPAPTATARLRTDLGNSFARQPGKVTEHHTSIPQALALMNGRFVNDATSLERSATLAAIADAPFLDTEGRIETLYLTTLSRKPTPEEMAPLVKYVTKGGPNGDPKLALADVFWALLNCSEFILNH